MSYKRTEIPGEMIEEQRRYSRLINEMWAGKDTAPLAFVDTYGCQQNEADSEQIRGMLAEMGYAFTGDEKEADVIVINTCAVREHAEMRIYGNVGALVHTKRAKPDQIIVMCGCMVQQPTAAERIRRSFRHVDLVFGPHALYRFPELLYRVMSDKKRLFSVEESEGAVFEGLPVKRSGGVKAWLPIMNGCNNFCSYCIVPYVRGRERSRLPEVIIKDLEDLVARGYRDITLLGQNVNSYGRDLSTDVDFSDILRMGNDVPGEFLIRFMTSHPKDASDKLFRTMAECGKVAKHIHLPFQSGNDRVLRAMNRRYTRSDYLGLVEMARSYVPDIVLTSDVIVGFPGETDEEFEDTLSLVREVEFDALFTFIYSRRSGTPAAEMPDPFTRAEKQVRFDKLIDLQNGISEKTHRRCVGTVQKVLVDGKGTHDHFNLTARTNGGRLVHMAGNEDTIGKFTFAEITDCNTWSLFGEELNQ